MVSRVVLSFFKHQHHVVVSTYFPFLSHVLFFFFARLLKFYLGFHWLIRFATIEERNLNDKKASYINTSWFVIS